MADSDLTVAVLREIRDAVRATNDKLDQTRIELSDRIDATNRRLDETRTELAERITAVETALKDLAGQQLLLTR